MSEKMPYNLEYENVYYTLAEQVEKRQFLLNFISENYRNDCLFVILDDECEDRPNKELKFRDDINDNLGFINDYLSDCQFAIYERMTKLELPDINCGNCKYLVRHYASADNMLGFSILREGHCIKTSRKKERIYDNKPCKDDCFEWNSQCKSIVDQLNKI